MKAGQISPTQAPAQSRTYSKLSANPMHEGSEPAPCGLRTSTSRRTAHSCATRRFAISCVSFFARTWRHAAASWPRVRWTGVLVTTRNSVGDTVSNVPAEKGARSFSPLQRRRSSASSPRVPRARPGRRKRPPAAPRAPPRRSRGAGSRGPAAARFGRSTRPRDTLSDS